MGSPRQPVRPPYGSAVLFFVTLLALALAGACTDILGIHDRTLVGGGGSGGGTGGTGGLVDACTTEADCAGSPFGEHCDSHGKCVECIPGPTDDCALGLYCDVTEVCVIGCADDADCKPQGGGPLTCDTATHQCKGCGANAPCPPGSKCNTDTGSCVPGCDTTPDCPTSDWACCNKQCKNVTKDILNCGACEDPCVPDQSTTWLCLDGGCVYQSCNLGWADCNSNVAKGDGCETDTQNDPGNCGKCGTTCAFDHAVAACSVGNCAIAACEGAFRDCDKKLANGCEVDSSKDAANCGACGTSCAGLFPHAGAACQGSACVPGECDPGYGDCDQNPENGCETELNKDPQHCGTCENACSLDHANATCSAGKCAIAECDPGFKNCDNLVSTGCEAQTNSDLDNCGACGTKCEYDNAGATCNSGTCGIGACTGDFADCNNDVTDGCETNLSSSATSCGTCGHACPSLNGTGTCVNKQCQFACAVGFGNCDGLDANGCETNLTNTVQDCATCGNECTSMSGGTPYCFMSACGETNCPPNKANCDGNLANGCETDLTLPDNCGSCGNHCSTTNGAASCNAGTCGINCNPGYGNCNNNLSDGCEQTLNTIAHCTACGTPCTRPHAITSCGSGTSCEIVSCEQGWADCNLNASDGCEANLDTSLVNCGACGSACAPANALGACVAGVCTIQSCNAPYSNCNGGVADGCEANLNGDVLHCGTCATQCSFPNATPLCNAGACQIASCNMPYANCDGLAGNGCEANLQSNTQNCGACGNVCAGVNGSATCTAGMCSLTCNQGYKNCDGLFNNGCERSIHTLMDCGDCNIPCSLPNATESCSTGACQIVSCDGGFTNCDNQTPNGCECASSCVSGMCQGCGDGTCNSGAGETCMSCPADCGSCPTCNDGVCNGAETCLTCPIDCGSCCGDTTCDAGIGETCASCSADCGMCCGNGTCDAIYGESCMSCPDDCGACPGCNDGTCDAGAGENCNSCPFDCGMCCGNGTCDTIFGETCGSCEIDCGICMTCGDGICSTPPEDCNNCPGDCCPSTSSSVSSSGSGTMSGSGGCGLHPGVACGGPVCNALMPGCCRSGPGVGMCAMPPTCPAGNWFQCDDVTDCVTPGTVCCHTLGSGSSCQLTCAAPALELCTTPSSGAASCECSGTQQCCPPGGKLNTYATCQPLGVCL